jgi:hypothetical protein
MRRSLALAVLTIFVGCSKQVPAASTATSEVTYAMTATIISRDPANNTLNLDNKEVRGKMMAMKMEYPVRGANVDALPRDGSVVVVTMHDRNGKYYVTDVKSVK